MEFHSLFFHIIKLQAHHNQRLSAFSKYDKYSNLVSFQLLIGIKIISKAIILRSKTKWTKNSEIIKPHSVVLYFWSFFFSFLKITDHTFTLDRYYKNKYVLFLHVLMVFHGIWSIVTDPVSSSAGSFVCPRFRGKIYVIIWFKYRSAACSPMMQSKESDWRCNVESL